MLNAKSEEVVFTSGATEGNNLAIHGLAGEGDVLASMIEHPCVIEPLKQLQAKGQKTRLVPRRTRWTGQSGRGSCGIGSRTRPRLVCLMLANHETGAIQPVQELRDALPPATHLHCDAAQAVGKIAVDFHELNVSTLTLSGHKFGAPVGIGALLIKAGTKFTPLTHGGHQQRGHRPGTEPIALAVGMVAALRESLNDLAAKQTHVRKLASQLWDRLQSLEGVFFNGPASDGQRLPHVLNVSFLGCRADILLASLDLAGRGVQHRLRVFKRELATITRAGAQ